ncbi:unnamed protein product, partial [Ectocarpus sp. 12 AP-2014]
MNRDDAVGFPINRCVRGNLRLDTWRWAHMRGTVQAPTRKINRFVGYAEIAHQDRRIGAQTRICIRTRSSPSRVVIPSKATTPNAAPLLNGELMIARLRVASSKAKERPHTQSRRFPSHSSSEPESESSSSSSFSTRSCIIAALLLFTNRSLMSSSSSSSSSSSPSSSPRPA